MVKSPHNCTVLAWLQAVKSLSIELLAISGVRAQAAIVVSPPSSVKVLVLIVP